MNVLVLGAGQLARMMSLSSKNLDIHVTAYDVGSEKVIDPVTFLTVDQSLQQAIDSADAITAEFEHIPLDILKLCDESGKFYPGTEAIATGGDRAKEKALLDASKVACAPYKIITEKQHLLDSIEELAMPLVVKTCQAGYDGKGQWRVKSLDDVEQIWAEMSEFLAKDTSHQIIAEKMIPLLGSLYRGPSVVLRVFGQKIMNASTIEIIKAHLHGQLIVGKTLDMDQSYAMLQLIEKMNLRPCRLDLGKLCHEYLEQESDEETSVESHSTETEPAVEIQ